MNVTGGGTPTAHSASSSQTGPCNGRARISASASPGETFRTETSCRSGPATGIVTSAGAAPQPQCR
ncbi:hypothetical protein C8R44DRAFT_784192, partial [Mycena epipterygia]